MKGGENMLIQLAYALDTINETVSWSNFKIGMEEIIEEDSEVLGVYNDVMSQLPSYENLTLRIGNESAGLEGNEVGYLGFTYVMVYSTDGTTVMSNGGKSTQLDNNSYNWQLIPFDWRYLVI